MPLPRQILVHGHWTQQGRKMSKSLGNIVTPAHAFSICHPDVVRYYMIKDGQDGGNWSDDALRTRYGSLANTWGNFVSRMTSERMELRTAVYNSFSKGVYQQRASIYPQDDLRLREAIGAAIQVYRFSMNNLNFQTGLSVIDMLWKEVSTSPSQKNTHKIIRMGCLFCASLGKHVCSEDKAVDFYESSEIAFLAYSISCGRSHSYWRYHGTTVYAYQGS
jgi:methionyl-tRNA synthetase